MYSSSSSTSFKILVVVDSSGVVCRWDALIESASVSLVEFTVPEDDDGCSLLTLPASSMIVTPCVEFLDATVSAAVLSFPSFMVVTFVTIDRRRLCASSPSSEL